MATQGQLTRLSDKYVGMVTKTSGLEGRLHEKSRQLEEAQLNIEKLELASAKQTHDHAALSDSHNQLKQTIGSDDFVQVESPRSWS